MNKEFMERVRNASEYQRKAILALLPESTGAHLEVIGKELGIMATELALDLYKGCRKNGNTQDENRQGDAVKDDLKNHGGDTKGVKKVTIG